MSAYKQIAPGALEDVRGFLNTWSIPNDTRVATDELPRLAVDPLAWAEQVSAYPLQAGDDLSTLLALRLDLRAACASHADDRERLQHWFEKIALHASLETTEGVTAVRLRCGQPSWLGFALATVANAIASGEWARLKSCGDCQWTFYDHTRNASKRWCTMAKGSPDGRACGTIAKVSAFRQRAASKARDADN